MYKKTLLKSTETNLKAFKPGSSIRNKINFTRYILHPQYRQLHKIKRMLVFHSWERYRKKSKMLTFNFSIPVTQLVITYGVQYCVHPVGIYLRGSSLGLQPRRTV